MPEADPVAARPPTPAWDAAVVQPGPPHLLRHPACLIVIGLCALLPACSSSTGDTVSVLGDSITSFDQPKLEQGIGADHDLAVSGNFGRTTAEVLPEARVTAARGNDQVIINLGTNDVQGGLPLDRSMDAMRTMVGLFPAARCVHLVNVNEHMVDAKTGRATTEAARRFNDALEALANEQPRVSVIDWNAEVEDTLNDGNPPTSTLTKDTVHPTDEGNDRLNDLYASALDAC
jgi:lysophospholipase L1-like esterase